MLSCLSADCVVCWSQQHQHCGDLFSLTLKVVTVFRTDSAETPPSLSCKVHDSYIFSIRGHQKRTAFSLQSHVGSSACPAHLREAQTNYSHSNTVGRDTKERPLLTRLRPQTRSSVDQHAPISGMLYGSRPGRSRVIPGGTGSGVPDHCPRRPREQHSR